VVGKLKAFVSEYHEFPRILFILEQAFLVTKTRKFGFQPPVKLQEAKFTSN